ncbi:MAG: hypothetical protein A3F68_01005 [Acidobacteria bacterium RIFCSPLOWO2_12_FULL_54_10]|nr:MAG: hypothetical protein A3F68_01005 [Acidobacteria bacterium RIFCSPLOWO2_12_FULL_54_10]
MLVVHIPALVMWVGGLLVVTLALASHTLQKSADAQRVLAELEKKILKSMVHPGAALAVISGLLLIMQAPGIYMSLGWMHAKLLLVVLLIVLDLRVHFRAKAYHAGKIQMQRGEAIGLHAGTALVFIGIVVMVFARPF